MKPRLISETRPAPLIPALLTLFALCSFLAAPALRAALPSQGIVVWGDSSFGLETVPAGLDGVTGISAGASFSLVLQSGGIVSGWGDNSFGQITIPAGLSGVTAIATGDYHALARQSGGTVVAWGDNAAGQATVPTNLAGVVAVAARGSHSLALLDSGTVVAWGSDSSGESTVPAGLSGVTAIAAGDLHSLALLSNGTVTAWESNASGQTTIPTGLSSVAAIAAGEAHSLALLSNGTVVAWGDNTHGESTVPTGLSGVTAIAAGNYHSLALLSNGTVLAWGDNTDAETSLPSGLAGATAIAAGGYHSLALVATPSTAPIAVTGSAAVTADSVTLNGAVTAGNSDSVVTFLYGPTSAYGSSVAATPQIVTGNASMAVSATLTGLSAHTTYYFSVAAVNAAGPTQGSQGTFVTVDHPPVAVGQAIVCNGGAVVFDPRIGDSDPDGDALVVSAVGQGSFGAVTFTATSVTYTPGVNYTGQDSFTYTISDGFGGTAQAMVTVAADQPFVASALGLGQTVSGQPAGTAYAGFGVAEPGAFAGAFQASSIKVPAIFAADGSLLLSVGESAPGIPGSSIATLGALSGDAAIVVLKPGGGTTAANNTALLTGLTTGSPQVAARTGTALTGLPAGVLIKSFGSIDGDGVSTFFLATLTSSGKTSSALLATVGAGVNVLVQTGQSVGARTVKIIGTLAASAGSLADGRWRLDGSSFGVRLGFSDGSQALYSIAASGSGLAGATLIESSGTLPAPLAGAVASSFGLPAFGDKGSAFVANLQTGSTGVSAANNIAVLNQAASLALLARKGAAAPDATGVVISGVTYKSFLDPVVGTSGAAAFAAQLQGAGVTAKNNTGVWYAADGQTVKLLARAGDPAPGGGNWAAFAALVIPDGVSSAPIFLATLAANPVEEITTANNLGLWGANRQGELLLLFRSAQTVTINGAVKYVKSFSALAPAPGSFGAQSGVDAAGHISVLAKFTDGTEALLQVSQP